MGADNMKGMFDRTLRNKIRMGNFESTEQDMLCLRSLFQFLSKPFSVADFYAGSGRALEVLTQETAAVTFGIEPNEEKYLEMRDRLSHALYGGDEMKSAGYPGIRSDYSILIHHMTLTPRLRTRLNVKKSDFYAIYCCMSQLMGYSFITYREDA